MTEEPARTAEYVRALEDRLAFVLDLLKRSREYVPENTWLAEQVDSEIGADT